MVGGDSMTGRSSHGIYYPSPLPNFLFLLPALWWNKTRMGTWSIRLSAAPRPLFTRDTQISTQQSILLRVALSVECVCVCMCVCVCVCVGPLCLHLWWQLKLRVTNYKHWVMVRFWYPCVRTSQLWILIWYFISFIYKSSELGKQHFPSFTKGGKRGETSFPRVKGYING